MLVLFLSVLYVDFSYGFLNIAKPNINFLGCEHIEDDTLGLKANERTEYNFIFNTSHTFNSYEVEICETDQLLQCKGIKQTSDCQIDTSLSGRISCGVIKSSVYPEMKKGSRIDLKFVIFGKNETGRYSILENQHQYVICELRGCKNEVDAVKFVEGSEFSWKPRTKQLQFELENIPIFTNIIFGQFLYDVVLLNDTHKRNILSRNLTNTENNLSKKKENYGFDQWKDTCISSFNRICAITRWTYCENNKTDLWQSAEICHSYNYADFFPKFIPQCMTENNEVKITVSLSDGPNQPLFYDFLIERKDVDQSLVHSFKTKNLTIPVAGKKGDIYSVSICDGCSCSLSIDLPCARPIIPVPTNDNTEIILGLTLTIALLLVLAAAYFFWRKKRKAKEEKKKKVVMFDEAELPSPRNEYTDAELQMKQEPHKYFNVATQEVE